MTASAVPSAARPARRDPTPLTGEILVRARIVPSEGRSRAVLERSWPLSPYALETIAEDARRAGPDAHLELVVVGSAATRETLAALEENLAWLFRRGVCVTVRREGRVP
jgi:hypothetical protein